MTNCINIVDKTKLLINDIVENPVLRLQQENVTGPGLANGTYKIKVTSVSLFGETTGGAHVSSTIAASGKAIKINIGRVKNAIRFRVYASVGTDDYTLQGEASITQNASSQFVLGEYTSTGSVIPTTNTATEFLRHELYEVALEQALSEYSKIEPKEVVKEITVTSGIYNYALPDDWVEGVSNFTKAYWTRNGESEEVGYSNVSVGRYITLSNFAPRTGDVLSFYYTVPYTCEDIPNNKITPFAMLCASYACTHIATGYSHNSNRQIGAEVVNFDMRSSDFRKMADMYRQQALKLLSSRGKAVFARWSDV